jgi:hypothetical protein
MSTSSYPSWAQEQIAELEAQIGRRITHADMAAVDINELGKTMTVARDPLLSEIRIKENAWNREHGSDPELS